MYLKEIKVYDWYLLRKSISPYLISNSRSEIFRIQYIKTQLFALIIPLEKEYKH